MKLDKFQDTIILKNDNKRLEIAVDVNGNLDFSMKLKSNSTNIKDAYCFIIDDEDKTEESINIYYEMSKFYENLLDEYNKNSKFYINRYSTNPIYNEKLDMFKFHSDNGKYDNSDFIRIFRKDGKYYLFFNSINKEFKLLRNQSKYSNFAKYFNEFYSRLCKEYIRCNNFNGKTYKYGDKK